MACGAQVTVARLFPDEINQLTVSPAVLTAHLKIINTAQPDIMIWGERNYLEYRHVRHMISDLDIRTQLQCIPTVRHANGVAVSSRDLLYGEELQDQLPVLFQTLRNTAHALRSGASNFSKVENTARIALKGAGFEIDFIHILDEDTLKPAGATTTSFRIVASATINGVPIEDSLGLAL